AEGDALRRADVGARHRARPRGARRDGVARPRGDDDGRRLARAPLRAARRELRPDDGRGAHRRGGAAAAGLLVPPRGGAAPLPLARRMKVLVLDGRFSEALLAGLDVTSEPGADVAAILTTPRGPVGAHLLDQLPALRIVSTASVGFDHVDGEAAA